MKWLVRWRRGERHGGEHHGGERHGGERHGGEHRNGQHRNREHRHGERRCSLCAGFESAIWELQQRDYPTVTTEEEYRVHRLQSHPVSQERAGPQPLTYTRVTLDNDAA